MYDTLPLARATRAKPDAIVIALFKGAQRVPADFAGLDEPAVKAVREAIKRRDFDLSRGAIQSVDAGGGGRRLFVAGLGDEGKFDAKALRIAAAAPAFSVVMLSHAATNGSSGHRRAL